jgi:hypothetical protein
MGKKREDEWRWQASVLNWGVVTTTGVPGCDKSSAAQPGCCVRHSHLRSNTMWVVRWLAARSGEGGNSHCSRQRKIGRQSGRWRDEDIEGKGITGERTTTTGWSMG